MAGGAIPPPPKELPKPPEPQRTPATEETVRREMAAIRQVVGLDDDRLTAANVPREATSPTEDRP
jgi:hypothetical protein